MDVLSVPVIFVSSHSSAEWASLPSDNWSCLNNEFVCTNVIAAWAVGGKPFQLPPDVGIPLETSYTYFMMQVRMTSRWSCGLLDEAGVEW